MGNDTRLHTVDCGGKSRVEIMIHEPLFQRVGICLDVSSGDDSASVNLTASAARAAAHLLLMAAEEAERRNVALRTEAAE